MLHERARGSRPRWSLWPRTALFEQRSSSTWRRKRRRCRGCRGRAPRPEDGAAAGGDYVFTVKGNQPTLHGACKNLPWAKVPAHRVSSTGHGRRATRTIKVVTAPDWVGFAGATQIAQIRRTVTRAGKRTVEVVYLITSADHAAAPPATLAAWVQGHWGIENKLHWVRDVTFDEDRSQIRTGSAPQVMATLRNTAISLLRLSGWDNIAAGLRHHARTPENPIKLLLAC